LYNASLKKQAKKLKVLKNESFCNGTLAASSTDVGFV
jgi:hypothetical protein